MRTVKVETKSMDKSKAVKAMKVAPMKVTAVEPVASFWEKETVVNKIALEKTAIRTAICAREGKNYIDIRKFVNKKGETAGFNQHTVSGISIDCTDERVLRTIISDLQKAYSAVMKAKVGAK